VLFGNEARGLPAHLVEQADRVVAIPIYGKAESLNLATSAAVMLMSLAMSSHIGKM
jgi:TrmH family RNA methyltransferase